jgi:hypothetical protein
MLGARPPYPFWPTELCGELMAICRRTVEDGGGTFERPSPGLANRYVLEEALAREAAARSTNSIALVLLDVDRFKQINDEHGHPVGDAVLIEVAHRLADTVRGSEVPSRELYELADDALSEAKQSGRNRTCSRQAAGSGSGASLASATRSPARPRGIPSTATTNASAIAAAMPTTTVFVAEAKSP